MGVSIKSGVIGIVGCGVATWALTICGCEDPVISLGNAYADQDRTVEAPSDGDETDTTHPKPADHGDTDTDRPPDHHPPPGHDPPSPDSEVRRPPANEWPDF